MLEFVRVEFNLFIFDVAYDFRTVEGLADQLESLWTLNVKVNSKLNLTFNAK